MPIWVVNLHVTLDKQINLLFQLKFSLASYTAIYMSYFYNNNKIKTNAVIARLCYVRRGCNNVDRSYSAAMVASVGMYSV